MIHYKYTSNNINELLKKKETIKSLLSRFTNNHSDYTYTTDISLKDNSYVFDAKLERP